MMQEGKQVNYLQLQAQYGREFEATPPAGLIQWLVVGCWWSVVGLIVKNDHF
jgi:hypothetical protein